MKQRTARFLLAIVVCSALVQPLAAQTSPPAPLPPAAQQALDKGIIAAKVPDYLLAIRFFEEARKFAPQAPVIFLNLGIAESKMPGRELRAIAWFGVYLAASPDAPNAAAVKQQIAVLDVKNQSNLTRFLKTVQDAANQTSVYKSENLCLVARLWVKAGNITEAVKIVDRMHPVPDSAYLCIQRAKREIAKAQEPPEAPSPDRKSTAGVKAAKGEIEWFIEQGGFAWLTELDGNLYNHSGLIISTNKARLGTEPFLDLAGHLKSLPPSDDPQRVFAPLYETAAELVEGQNGIHYELNRQATK